MKCIIQAASCLTAALLITVTAANAAAPAINGQMVFRPVTPGDVSAYKLPTGTESSPGLATVGIGNPLYLEVEINRSIAASNILSVTWALTNVPANSMAALTASPLGTNVPVYEVADRGTYQVASRMLLRPDLVGRYTIIATVVIGGGSGTTNLTRTITAGTYMGLSTCMLCHSGSEMAENKYDTWSTTAHAHIFTDEINGKLGTTYRASCLPCHTAGYNANTNASNNGFDDIARTYNPAWTIPAVLAPTNWAYMQATYPDLADLANVQCENCHGPGSQHAYSLGDTNLISKTLNSGDCNQCHDAPTHHIYGTQWYTSGHANPTRTPSTTANRWPCIICHTAQGFIDRIDHMGSTNTYTTNVTFGAIGCQTCHEAHGETTPPNNPHLLRVGGPVTLPDGTVVNNAGNGAICMQCHQVRNGAATNQVVNYPIGKPTWMGGSSFGVHDASQADMLEGVNAFTYGKSIPSSAHRNLTNTCVACHMQEAGATSPAYLQAGGHTFGLTYNVVTTNGLTLVTNTHEMTEVCAECHGEVESFNLVRQDYNGDGVIEGVQTEVQKLMDKLSTMLPNSTYQANSNNYIADGLVKTSVSFKTNWPAKFLKAGYNWQFVNNDFSKGVHNAAFAVGILKASIADLTGDSNNDSLPDSWQIQYFGSPNAAAAAPNAMPAGDGVPNWMKYILGLNPMLPGISVTNGLSVGVVWASGNSLQNPYGATNTVQIFTAAEVTFNTEAGKTYQIQAASSVSSGWQNVGAPIVGTGKAVSYVTPTRQDVQQFYRYYSY